MDGEDTADAGWIMDDPSAYRVPKTRSTEHLSPSAELSNLMRAWRLRLTPDQIPGLAATGRSKHSISQETAAMVVGASTKWYGSLERGDLDERYSDTMLDRVAAAFGLSDDERVTLFLLAAGREPPPRLQPDPGAVDGPTAAVLKAQPWPAWVHDPSWEILALNDASYDWFPHTRIELNIMRWIFAYPSSQLQLVDWETDWAPSMLAQMRAAHARWPDYTPLKQLVAETIAVNDYAHRLWHDDPSVQSHPDGEIRRLWVPHAQEPTQVRFVAWAPVGDPDLRVVMVVPVGGHIPPACAALVGDGSGLRARPSDR